MSAFPGSSVIPVSATITEGPRGFTGITGPTGNKGPTGESLRGFTGPTGIGIIGVTYVVGGGISFTNSRGNTLYASFSGITGTSYDDETPRGILLATGLTQLGYSVLYSYVDSYVLNNEAIVEPNSPDINPIFGQTALYVRTLEFSGSALKGKSADSSYIYLDGKTFGAARPIGNTGEILYVSGANAFKSVDQSKYTEATNLLSVALGPDRHPIHNNQNVQTGTFVFGQNISGFSGPTGYAFFQNDFGQFSINNNKYQSAETQKKSDVTLQIGTTGSDSLTFKFFGVTFDSANKFTPQIQTDDNFGSCCFCQSDTTEIKCLDYVSNSYCVEVGGSFSTSSCLNRISSGDCYNEGACCVNGKCINTSLEKCVQYKGTFFPGEVCAASGQDSSYFTCPNTCEVIDPTTGKCCFRGFCFDLTEFECDSLPGAKFNSGVCVSPVDEVCCGDLIGACCEKSGPEYSCTQKHPSECTGIFHGANTQCTEVECCGKNFIETYFNSSTDCRLTSNQPCLPIGTKIGGGYLVGVVGMPSPCSSYGNPLVAYGQPLACRVHPRGSVVGPNSFYWNFKNCGGANGSTLGAFGAYASDVNFEYFLRTKSSDTVNLNYADNALNKCLLKFGTPYIQQTYKDITSIQGVQTTVQWLDNIQYVGSMEYNLSNGFFAYPVGGAEVSLNYIIPEKHSNESPNYKYLAEKYYSANNIHMLWALIVAPDDAYSSSNLIWGMEEGRARLEGYNEEPITSFAVDGLLMTRIFDESSKENPNLWFRDPQGTGKDLKAYDRFAFYNPTNITKRTNWNLSVVENTIETNINVFKQNYSEMWDTHNPENSCTKQISILNQTSYEGYNDWYIPSITELNYIYENVDAINASILVNSEQLIDTNSDYWSSTTVSYLKSWSASNHLDYTSYQIEETPTSQNKNSKYRFIASDFSGLNDKKAYELSLNVSAGENMLIQSFVQNGNNAGLVSSKNRKLFGAKLRPVRRIPIIIGSSSDNIETILNAYDFSNCNSCP
jgi:hypothetical protein